MKLIKVIKPKTNKCSISSIELEVSAAYCNVPAMKIDVVQEVNISDLSTELFNTEEQALKAVFHKISGHTAYEVPWFQKGISNVFIARLLTDEQGQLATDQAISQWKNGNLRLNMMDIYVTLAYQ